MPHVACAFSRLADPTYIKTGALCLIRYANYNGARWRVADRGPKRVARRTDPEARDGTAAWTAANRLSDRARLCPPLQPPGTGRLPSRLGAGRTTRRAVRDPSWSRARRRHAVAPSPASHAQSDDITSGRRHRRLRVAPQSSLWHPHLRLGAPARGGPAARPRAGKRERLAA
jgi:hypothetical protein